MSNIRRSKAAAVFFFAAASIMTTAGAAYAEQHVLNGTHSKDEVNAACDSVGGIQTEGQGGKGYGCYNPKNGSMVACANSGVCTGYTQTRSVPSSLRHLLNLPATDVSTYSPDASPTGNGNDHSTSSPADGGKAASSAVIVIY